MLRPSLSRVPSSDPARSFSSPPQIPPGLHNKPSEASRLRAAYNGNGNNTPNSHHDGTSSLRSHPLDGRRSPDTQTDILALARPSQQRRNESLKTLLPGTATVPPQTQDEGQNHAPVDETISRGRGLSTSSSQSAAYFTPTVTLRPSTSIPDFHSSDVHARQRKLNVLNHRPLRGMERPDSNYSAHKWEPASRPFEGDEVRASFRSALTTHSSYLGTSGTERSSVLTKSSSRTSIFGKDEGLSVDDFLGMYEGGFTDSGVEDNDGVRPATATSEDTRISKLCEAMNQSLMVRPSTQVIRDSSPMLGGGDIESHLDTPISGVDSPADLQNFFFDGTATSRPMTRAAPIEMDSTRDRYGFRKKTQHVSLEEYEAWSGPYNEYLARRHKKWVTLLKEGNLMTDRPNRFPPKSNKVKRFVRKGIPPDWRGDAWFYYAGGPGMLSRHPGVYDELVSKAAAGGVSETDNEIIERDLNRTFPDNIRFKPDSTGTDDAPEPEAPIVQSLRRVLQAFAIYNPRIGYCQSLNFLAGLLLLFMNEEKSFWMLNIITHVYLPGTHEVNLEGANVDLGVLMISIRETMPSVWARIGGELDGTTVDPKVSMRLPPITLCATAWFMSCFIGTLPIETTLRVWDSFFYEGSKTLFRIALTIFKIGEQEIKNVTDQMEIFQVVQTIPRRLIDANLVLDTCFKRRGGFSSLSQEKIEQRRQERREGYAQERQIANGEIPTQTVRRKATVFRRKRAVRVPTLADGRFSDNPS
jgi:hypothetical protein